MKKDDKHERAQVRRLLWIIGWLVVLIVTTLLQRWTESP
ncbi:MAG: hypothetical protein JWN07_3264 [Hyphomicrobiales bacterium]|nr:hypothetical protein [Hyphomicrobiales bacterium]